MAKFRYIGTPCIYPSILVPEGGSLVVDPGDVHEFDTPPDKTWWVEVVEPPKEASSKSLPKEVK